MTRTFRVVLWLVGLPAAAPAQTGLQALYDSAFYAWEAGAYDVALQGFDRLLAAPGGERFLEPVALVTGELYPTVTVTPDGRAVQWSPNGRFISFEAGAGLERRIYVWRLEPGGLRRVADLTGFGLAFSPGGVRAAYLSVPDTPELRTARAAVDSLFRARSLDEARRRGAELARLEARLARVVVRELASGRAREIPASGLAKRAVVYGADDQTLYLVAGRADGDPGTTDIYSVAPTGNAEPQSLTDGPGAKGTPVAAPGGLVYTIGTDRLAVGRRVFAGTSPAVSADGTTLVFLSRSGDTNTVNVLAVGDSAPPLPPPPRSSSSGRWSA